MVSLDPMVHHKQPLGTIFLQGLQYPGPSMQAFFYGGYSSAYGLWPMAVLPPYDFGQ